MADTFTNDLRLRLQESGANSGQWGTLLNTTISNIASAFSLGSEAIPNASTHTITLADGTADEARSMYLKCTGGGQACTVTLAPNTISKVWIISNETSATLTFSQGSGANVAIAAGAVKVIVTDGAGSGAAVVDALSGLSANVSDLTTTGNISFGDNDKAIFGAGSDLQIFHDGSNSHITEGGTGDLIIRGANIEIQTGGGNKYFQGSSNVARLYHTNNEKLATTSIGIDVTGTVTASKLGITEGELEGNSGNLQVQSLSTGIIYDAANGFHTFRRNGTNAVQINGTNGNSIFFKSNGSEAMRLTDTGLGVGTSSPIAPLQIQSDNPQVVMTQTGGGVNRFLALDVGLSADLDTQFITVDQADALAFGEKLTASDRTIENEWVRITNSGVVQISNATPTLKFTDTDNNYDATIQGLSGSLVLTADSGAEFGTESIQFKTGGLERMRVDSSGNVLVGRTSVGATGAGHSIRGADSAIFSRDGGEVLIVNRDTDQGSLVELRQAGTARGLIGTVANDLFIASADSGHNGLRFHANGILPTNNAGAIVDADADLGVSTHRFKDLYLSGGAYLGGTAAANQLSSYEEGTWVPTFHAYTGSLPSTLTTTNAGSYTKVGQMVSLTGYLQVDSVSGASSNIINIRGLPFTVIVGDGKHQAGAFTASSINFARTTNLAITTFGTTELGFLTSNNNAGWGWEYFNVLNNGSFMRFEITYYTSQ